MTGKKHLLILGPSFRRNRSKDPLPAIERYDGLFFRVARKYLKSVRNVDVAIMLDDLTLVSDDALLPNKEPEGQHWGTKTIADHIIENAKIKNQGFLSKKLGKRKYSEVFISMGKEYAKALPALNQYNLKLIFPATGGPGPKAQALKEWLIAKK